MSERAGRPLWIRPVLAACAVLVRSYPKNLERALGPDILADVERRLIDTRHERGAFSAAGLAVRELVMLAVSAVEARRELARGVRLGAPGLVGVRLRRVLAPIRRDVADALRGLARTPGPVTMVVVMIGLGTGMSTAIFSVVDRALLDPVPFDQADRLVHVWADRSWQNEPHGLLADLQIRQLRRLDAFEDVSALWMVSGRILGGARPVHTDVARVSDGFFDLLDVEPLLGRTFAPGEERPGAPWVAILDYDYWLREFGGDPDVVGRTLRVGWPEMRVIGVLPPDFRFRIPPELGDHRAPELWIPWWHQYAPDGRAGGGTLAAVARLADGVTLEQASRQLAEAGRREDREHYDGRGFRYGLEPLETAWVAQVRPGLTILAGAVSLVLLIAIANATTLLLARAQSRSSEIGVRFVLGASPGGLARLLIAEALLITAMGGVLGVALALVGTDWILRLAPVGLHGLESVALNGPMLAVATLTSVLAGSMAVVPSVVSLRRSDPAQLFRRSAAPTRTLTRRARHARDLMMVAQVAFSVALLVGAGLLLRTFDRLERSELGFEPEGRLTFSVYLMDDYPTLEGQQRFYRRLSAGLSALPDVRAVGGVSALPLSTGAPQVPASTFARERDVDPDHFFLTEGFSTLLADELDDTGGADWSLVDLAAAQPGYFGAAGIPLLSGRTITWDDDAGASRRVIVDRLLAERFWSVDRAVGERIWIAGAWREVVGVVDHARLVEHRAEARPQAYLPHAQVRSGRVSMVVHARAEAETLTPDIRRVVAEIDPLVPIADVRPMAGIVEQAVARDRFSTTLMTVFAATAVTLVALGLYGVLSFTVGERTREIAVRLTAGSGRLRVAGGVIGHSVLLGAAGLLPGLGVALLLAWAARPLLFGVTPYDPASFAAAAGAVLLVSVLASWWPVRRAVSVNPVDVLTSE